MSALDELVLELTDWCPLSCAHCSSCSGSTCVNHLDVSIANRLVDEAASLGATRVSFGGGEPTASPAFLDIVRRTVSRGMVPEVFTCGVAGNGSHPIPLPEPLVSSLSAIPKVRVIFSLHGPSLETHEAITGVPGSYQALIRSLDASQKAKINCQVNFVPMKPNAEKFGAVLRFAKNRGIPRVSVLRFVPQGRGAPNARFLQLSVSEEGRFLELLVHLRQNSEVDIRTGSPFNHLLPDNRVPCRAGISKIVVQADGNVLPCEVFKESRRRNWGVNVSSIPLTVALRSPQISALRERLLALDCLQCPVHALDRTTLLDRGRDGHQEAPVHV
jgi:radical SAM protein with 4Fe4S-binding SPASM domain